jgi:signal transduction histidine kinase
VRRAGLALLPLGIAAGVAAELAAAGGEWSARTAADLAVGIVLVACGTIASHRRSDSRSGALLSLAGFAWFLGTAVEWELYLHRGPLVHLVLSYPTGRLRLHSARAVTVAVYALSSVEPFARNDVLTLVLAAVVAATALRLFLGASGPARRARAPALAAAFALAGVLAFGVLARLSASGASDTVLWTYDAVVAAVAAALLVDLLRSRWAEAVVTRLVVDLGDPGEAGTLRAKLARALGDPTLVLAYRLPETGAFVDDSGRAVDVGSPGPGRTVTPIEGHGERLAVLIHDTSVLADPDLVESVARAARLAVANARLQAEARARAAELETSRRRIVEAGDAQSRRLERELRVGAERRLESVATLLRDARANAPNGGGDAIELLERDLADARRALREFAQGVHPVALEEGGLMQALGLLAERSPLPIEVRGTVGRLPGPIEAALFFVCSEAVANAAKHAAARRVLIELGEADGTVWVTVADDGTGGADPTRGSGLRGLADRVEALGGRLDLASAPGDGTRLSARLPLAARGDHPARGTATGPA